MKITYDEIQDRGECEAYIDRDGDLVMPDVHQNCSFVTIGQGGCLTWPSENLSFDPSEATRKFYPGDSITITF